MSDFITAYLAVSLFCGLCVWRRVVLDEWEAREK